MRNFLCSSVSPLISSKRARMDPTPRLRAIFSAAIRSRRAVSSGSSRTTSGAVGRRGFHTAFAAAWTGVSVSSAASAGSSGTAVWPRITSRRASGAAADALRWEPRKRDLAGARNATATGRQAGLDWRKCERNGFDWARWWCGCWLVAGANVSRGQKSGQELTVLSRLNLQNLGHGTLTSAIESAHLEPIRRVLRQKLTLCATANPALREPTSQEGTNGRDG